MIYAKTSDGTLIAGVDAENVRRLTAGHPIVIRLDAFKGANTVMLVYGETLDAIKQALEEAAGPLPPAQPMPKGAH